MPKPVLEIIRSHSRKTANLSGITAIEIAKQAGINIPETRKIVKQLLKSNKITWREGINNPLFFATNTN